MPRKATKIKAKRKAADKEPVSVYILLDRSGSMESRMGEAVRAINAYVAELAGGDTPGEVSLCTFDDYQGLQFDVVRKRVSAASWNPVTPFEVAPRGGTPLYDAIRRISMAAEIEGSTRTVIAIMTDGYENASKDTTKFDAKAMLDKARSKEWQVLFLGADFDAFGQASWVGSGISQTLNLTAGNYMPAMRAMASSTKSYGAVGAAMNFSDHDRAVASGKAKAPA